MEEGGPERGSLGSAATKACCCDAEVGVVGNNIVLLLFMCMHIKSSSTIFIIPVLIILEQKVARDTLKEN